MLRSSHYENELIGSTYEINISDICQSLNPLRNEYNNIGELADSIAKIGLLSPILVRTTESNKLEIVAGNRRFKACKSLGWKKIVCHIVVLDDKSAFEASMIENIQRNTLNIIEEGLAFKKYVKEFGWGGATELARKLSKSSSYVSKRMKILELPPDVLKLLSDSEITASAGEELLSIKEKDKQSKFAMLAFHQSISSKKLRKLIKDDKWQIEDWPISFPHDGQENEKSLKAFDNSLISLKIAMNRIASVIEKIEDRWIVREILMNHKNAIGSQIDLLIRERKKFINNGHFFRVNF